MRVLDLFSGIGGFSLGLERAGMETVAFCESDKKCQLVLKKHWPEIPIYDDIRQLTGKQIAEEIGAIDLICGGFPCQGFSVAGKRQGKDDDRYLWPEYFRLIQEIRSRWVIGENVTGILSMGIDAILSDLERIAYALQTFDTTAGSYGLPSLERHIWIIASSHEERCEGSKEVQNPHERIEVKFPRNHPREYERWNLPETRICGVGERISGKMDRLEQLGNAVDPIMPEIFGRAIKEIQTRSARL